MADLPTAIAHRGEVWWANVPGDKRRPVLILTREQFISRLNALLVAPLTMRREHFIERITEPLNTAIMMGAAEVITRVVPVIPLITEVSLSPVARYSSRRGAPRQTGRTKN